jgi:hypothetical protein
VPHGAPDSTLEDIVGFFDVERFVATNIVELEAGEAIT